MRNVLITGGAGFIGSHLVEKLVKNKDYIVVLDNFGLYYEPEIKRKNLKILLTKPNFKLITGDIRDSSLLKKIFSNYTPDSVVHLAAKVGVRNSLIYPREYADVNILGTINLLEMVRNNRVKNFIFSSSSSIYGSNKKLPFSEDDSVNDQLSPYAVSKRSAELYCEMYSSLYNIPITILRLFTVYGPRQRPDLAVSKFIRKITNNEEIEIYGDGTTTRDFIYIDDVIEGMFKVLDNPSAFEIINLGSSNPITINSLITYLEKIIGEKAKKKYLSFCKEDMRITHADIKKAKKLLNWEPTVDIKDGLQKTLDYLNL